MEVEKRRVREERERQERCIRGIEVGHDSIGAEESEVEQQEGRGEGERVREEGHKEQESEEN